MKADADDEDRTKNNISPTLRIGGGLGTWLINIGTEKYFSQKDILMMS